MKKMIKVFADASNGVSNQSGRARRMIQRGKELVLRDDAGISSVAKGSSIFPPAKWGEALPV